MIHPDFKITRLERVDPAGLVMNITLERQYGDGGLVVCELDGLSLTAVLFGGVTTSNMLFNKTAELKFKLARGIVRCIVPAVIDKTLRERSALLNQT